MHEKGFAGAEEGVEVAHEFLAVPKTGHLQFLLEYFLTETHQPFARDLFVDEGCGVLRKCCDNTQETQKKRVCVRVYLYLRE